MCLITKNFKPSIADEDIVCYKILSINLNKEYIETPFTNTFISEFVDYFNREDKGIEFSAKGEKEISKRFNVHHELVDTYEIGCGYIHTFKDFNSALHYMADNHDEWIPSILVKCIIPKGSEFYEGTFEYLGNPSFDYVNDKFLRYYNSARLIESYASDKIIITKEYYTKDTYIKPIHNLKIKY